MQVKRDIVDDKCQESRELQGRDGVLGQRWAQLYGKVGEDLVKSDV